MVCDPPSFWDQSIRYSARTDHIQPTRLQELKKNMEKTLCFLLPVKRQDTSKLYSKYVTYHLNAYEKTTYNIYIINMYTY